MSTFSFVDVSVTQIKMKNDRHLQYRTKDRQYDKSFLCGQTCHRYFAIKTSTQLTIQFLSTRRERGITIVHAAAIRADIAGSRIVEVQTPLHVYQN